MPTWVKILVVLITLPTWVAVVIVSLMQGQIPNPALMAIPAGVIVATSGGDLVNTITKRRPRE